MKNDRIFKMKFKDLYPLYVQKVERKGKTFQEVDELITWLLGYTQDELKSLLNSEVDVKTFFDGAINFNPHAYLIKGKICGITIEEIEDPLMQKIRYLDKIIDELAKDRPMSKIKREM